MSKKLATINGIQSNNTTEKAAVSERKTTRRGKTKDVAIQTNTHVTEREAELAMRLLVSEAKLQQKKEDDARMDAMRKETMSILATALNRNYGMIEDILRANGRTYTAIDGGTIDKVQTRRRAETSAANAREVAHNLHDAEVYSVKEAVEDSTVPAPVKTEKKTTKGAKVSRSYNTYGKGKNRRKSQIELKDVHEVEAKNGQVYVVGWFERTDNGKKQYLVKMSEKAYTKEGVAWLKETFGCKFSGYAGGFLFEKDPTNSLKRGKATCKGLVAA